MMYCVQFFMCLAASVISQANLSYVPQGDLHITYEVVFPTALSEHQRTMLRAAFFLPHKLDAKQSKAVRSFETAFTDNTHGWISAFRAEGQDAL